MSRVTLTNLANLSGGPRIAKTIAFLGRSNVGKSSLIKELLNAAPKVQVRTSKTPGHTKLVNFFEVGNAFMLVDMPGYGYRQPENFERSAEGYLNNSKRLSMTFLLVDSSVGLQPADYIAIDMLNEFGLPFTFILTKYDKAGKRALYSTLLDLRETMDKKAPTCFPQPFLVSLAFSFCSHITCGKEPVLLAFWMIFGVCVCLYAGLKSFIGPMWPAGCFFRNPNRTPDRSLIEPLNEPLIKAC
ncbi:GTP-binding protein 8 [Apostichopus japonicus]|uniref:GTP-binding protein 8 n=1 Tax=Stichopus japonicus TaxID=307972 RepID=A0A2G8KBM0_STIJA|nr:GTP-binding protein 8 [Apostichopus japonicus]